MGQGDYNLGSDTNQQQGHADGFGGAAQALGIASNFQANAPNSAAYNRFANQAYNQQGTYNGLANAAQGRQGAQIQNPYQSASRATMAGAQGDLGRAFDAAGQIQSVAQNQFQNSLDQSIRSNMALANSGRAGSVQNAGLARAAQAQNAQTMQGATNDAAIQRANEQAQMAGLQSGIAGQEGQLGLGQYSLEQQDAEHQAALAQAQGAQNDAYGLGLYGLGNQSQGQQLAAINGSTEGTLGAQKINAGTANNAAAMGGQLFGSALNAGGQVIGGQMGGGDAAGSDGIPPVMSDPKLKRGMHGGGDLVDSFLKHVDPKVFSYKQSMDEPTSSPTGGKYLGVSADQVAKTPVLGQQLVKKTPRGKALDVGPSISATLAGLGRLHSRVARLERGGR